MLLIAGLLHNHLVVCQLGEFRHYKVPGYNTVQEPHQME